MTLNYYNLGIKNSNILEHVNNINSDENKIKVIEWKKTDKGNNYFIIKYNKEFLTEENISTIGLFRSIIIKNNNIIVFSPPKSICYSKFIRSYTPDDCIAEEFIEGTMINLFYDSENEIWEIATKSSIGANMCFFINDYKHNTTFREMFFDIVKNINLDFDKLPKNYCYSFVIQHNKNRIVSNFSEHKLYLISVYDIDNEN
jgi:hypothetical protein